MKSIKLKLFTPWKHLDTYSDEWDKRLMPANKVWQSDKFAISWTHNTNEADYHVIMNFPQHDAKYSPDKAILLRMEPAKLFMGTPFQNPEPSIYRYLFSQRNSLEWHLGRSFDELTNDLLPENDLKIASLKIKVMSTITSGLQVDPGHRLRYQFLSYLEDFKGFDFFGRDHSTNKAYRGPLTNRVKDDGLIPYKYTVAAENNWEANYFTEKIVDAILAECLCFYWGCPNIEQYIDERAFIRIPIERPLEAVEIIKKAIDNDEYSKRLPYIRAMKKKIVNELQIMPTLGRIIDEIQEQEALFNQLFVDKASIWRLLPDNKIAPGLLQQLPQLYTQSKHLDNFKLGDKIAVKFNSDISSFVKLDSKAVYAAKSSEQPITMVPCKPYSEDLSDNKTQELHTSAIKLASNPQTSGRLCTKMFQLSHLIATKMEIKDKLNRHADIYFNVGQYKYFTGIYSTVDASCNPLSKWEQPDYKFTPIPTKFLESGVMVNGYVQSHKFFQQYNDQIINYWLSLPFGADKSDIDKYFAKLIGTASDVIAIHVRRTDYVIDKNHPTLPMSYYNNAISLMEARRIHTNTKSEVKYLVFSDDKKWCKEQKWEVPVTIVDLQNENIVNSDYFELLLMARCNSFIIANSTYSWWGAYLSKSRDVIYPDIWFGGSIKYLETEDIFPDHWVSVSCEQNVDIKELGVFLRESKGVSVKDAKYYDDRITKAWRLKRYSEGFKAILQLNTLQTEDATKYVKEHQLRLESNISYYLPK